MSLSAIAIAVGVGFTLKVNTGLVSIAFAFVLSLIFDISASEVVTGWPTSLFLTLLGMTLLFTIASMNGTLTVVARICTGYTRGDHRLLPLLFFALAAVIAGLGPGNIAACALLLPIALTVSGEEGLSPLLMSTMVITGSNVGGLSPIAPTGIIAATVAAEQGLRVAMPVFRDMAISGTLFAALCYLFLGGLRLGRSEETHRVSANFNTRQRMTLLVILLVVLGILVLEWDIGMTAFTGAIVLLLMGAGREEQVLRGLPWPALILVCGVAVLVHVMELTGGIDLVTAFLRSTMTPLSMGPGFVLIGGAISTVSSAGGVVLPTLIPVAPGLVRSMAGGLTAEQLISAIVIGSHVVTTSPISTLGALAVASASADTRDRLFRGLFLIAGAGLVFGAIYVFVATFIW